MSKPVNINDAEWASPKPVSQHFGVPRSTLYDWIKRGLIRSSSMKEAHQRHGKRLIHVPTLRKFIEDHTDERWNGEPQAP